jgi:hypothetical protein
MCAGSDPNIWPDAVAAKEATESAAAANFILSYYILLNCFEDLKNFLIGLFG